MMFYMGKNSEEFTVYLLNLWLEKED
jgi:hypothetical protein